MYNQQLFIVLALLYKVFAQHIVYAFMRRIGLFEQFPRCKVKRHIVVPRLLIFGSELVSVAFLSVNMHYNRMVNILHLLKSLNKDTCIVALFHIHIIESECTKQVVFALPASSTQL